MNLINSKILRNLKSQEITSQFLFHNKKKQVGVIKTFKTY